MDIKKQCTELRTIYNYLKENTATGSMVCAAKGIKHKNFCRRKRALEKANLLFEVERKYCKVTNYLAWYLTTDKSKVPADDDLRLF